ncbi:Uncharacterised protein [Collinsella intestinalis]|nr:Uncharacterised protein [Collinsella intestinalis]
MIETRPMMRATVHSTHSFRGPLIMMMAAPAKKITRPLPRSPATTAAPKGTMSIAQNLTYSLTESMRPLYCAPSEATKKIVMSLASSTGWKVSPISGILIHPVMPLAL